MDSQNEYELWPDTIDSRVQINTVLLDDMAKPLQKSRPNDLGYDVFCIQDEEWNGIDDGATFALMPGQSKTFRTGIKVQCSNQQVGFLFRDRSSMAVKDIHCLGGVVDGAYIGEWLVHLINLGKMPHIFHVGDKIVQAVPTMSYNMPVTIVEELEDTDRGERGFGSSGR